jgi:hypothetical protein
MDDGGSVAVSDRDQGIALKLHQEAQELRSSVGRGLYELAFRLFIIHRYELWRHVDPDLRSWEEYVEVYRFGDWARGKQFALMGQVKDLVLPALSGNGEPPPEPENLSNWLDKPEVGTIMERVSRPGWSKAEIVRPAVRKGLVSLDEALADAETLGRKDLMRKYDSMIAPEKPRVQSCFDCVNLHRGDPARGDKLQVVTGHGQTIPLHGMDFRYCPKMSKAWAGREGRAMIEREAEEAAKGCPGFDNGELPKTQAKGE